MKKLQQYAIYALFFVMLVGNLGSANAQTTPPGLPSSFNGEIHFMPDDGGPIEGDLIDAYVTGVTAYVAQANIQTFETNLVYAIKVPADNPATPEKDGGLDEDTVTFKIGERIVASGAWVGGSSVELNIHPPKADAGGPYPEVEVGQSFDLSGSASDWLGTDNFDYAWDLDNDGAYDDSDLQNPSVSFDSPGTKTLGLKVTDSQDGEGFDSATVQVGKLEAEVTLSNLTQVFDTKAKEATVTTNPSGLTVDVTYNGSETAPINAGTYEVVATVVDDVYQGFATGDLVISPADAGIILTDLNQDYDGGPKPITVTTDPPGLSYSVLYDGITDPPSATGIYPVEVTITDTNYTGIETGSLVIRATQEITLLPGWNLVSFNLQPYPIKAPSDLLDSIAGSFDLVYAWDASGSNAGSGNWMKYDDVELTEDTLTELDETYGFWVHVTSTENQTLTVKGFMPDQTNINLLTGADGWNLVGFPSSSNVDPEAAFGSVLTENSRVYKYNASVPTNLWTIYDPSAPSYVNDLDQMAPGYGYWVFVDTEADWDVLY